MQFDNYKLYDHPELSAVAEMFIAEHGPTRKGFSQFKYAMRAATVNLWQCVQSGEPLEICLTKKNYAYHKWFSHAHITSIVNYLVANDYVIKRRGYPAFEDDGVKIPAKRTHLYCTDKLCSLLDRMYGVEIGYDCALAPFVFLRDDSGQYIQPSNSILYHTLERNCRTINSTLLLHQYTVYSPTYDPIRRSAINDNDLRCQFYLRRIFSRGRRSMDRGGRFYSRALTGGMHPQGMPKEMRKRLLIDGESTVEVDYKSLHVALAYALAGVQLDYDPYSVVDADRGDAKLMLLIAFNAKDRLSALRAFRDDTGRWEPDIYDTIVSAHPNIAQFIGSDCGIKFQRADSDIAEYVLMHFASKGEACIPIHDSFIVKLRHRDELIDVMEEAYGKVMGGYKCNVEVG